MTIRPFHPFDVQALTSVDAALDAFDAGIVELIETTRIPSDHSHKTNWILDGNMNAIKDRCDKVEELIRSETKHG